jgi:cytoskeleton protein RodZ
VTAAAPAASASGPAAGVAVADGIVVFRTRGPSWVQVTDAGGATVLRRLMTSGDSAAATGRLPLAVTVGDAKQTDVQVRGKAFDLAPLARDNVARFEVK